MTGSILIFADMDADTGRIRVVVNPNFLEMYAESFVTNIDLIFRTSLKSDLSKAFYRFYQGHYEVSCDIEMMKLARAVNLDAGQETSRLRSKIRAGLVELKQRGYLEAFELTKDHRVIVKKSGNTAISFDGQILNPAKFYKVNA